MTDYLSAREATIRALGDLSLGIEALEAAIRAEYDAEAAPDLVAAVEALPGRWVAERGYPGDHHGIDYVDRDAVLALLRAAPSREAGS